MSGNHSGFCDGFFDSIFQQDERFLFPFCKLQIVVGICFGGFEWEECCFLLMFAVCVSFDICHLAFKSGYNAMFSNCFGFLCFST